jgi:hypothetical protein
LWKDKPAANTVLDLTKHDKTGQEVGQKWRGGRSNTLLCKHPTIGIITRGRLKAIDS